MHGPRDQPSSGTDNIQPYCAESGISETSIAYSAAFAPNGMLIAPPSSVPRDLDFHGFQQKENVMLWTILVILLVLWLLGFIGHVGGGLIHLLLVIALIIFIINIVSGRRTV